MQRATRVSLGKATDGKGDDPNRGAQPLAGATRRALSKRARGGDVVFDVIEFP